MAVGAAGSVGRFEIVRKSTFPSYAQAYRKKLKDQQMSAAANAANVLYGTISSQTSGLSQIALAAATDRTRQEIARTALDALA
jgi:hypothetical protein